MVKVCGITWLGEHGEPLPASRIPVGHLSGDVRHRSRERRVTRCLTYGTKPVNLLNTAARWRLRPSDLWPVAEFLKNARRNLRLCWGEPI